MKYTVDNANKVKFVERVVSISLLNGDLKWMMTKNINALNIIGYNEGNTYTAGQDPLKSVDKTFNFVTLPAISCVIWSFFINGKSLQSFLGFRFRKIWGYSEVLGEKKGLSYVV